MNQYQSVAEDFRLETVERETVIFNPGMPFHEIEKSVILETLRQQKYNRTHTAKVLGIGIRTLQRKLKQYRGAA